MARPIPLKQCDKNFCSWFFEKKRMTNGGLKLNAVKMTANKEYGPQFENYCT